MIKIFTIRPPSFSRLIASRRVRIGVGSVVALVLLYTAIGFLALPVIIQSQLTKAIQEKLGRSAVVETVKVNPFALTVALSGLRVMEANGKDVFASIDSINLDLSAESLIRLAPVIEYLQVSTPLVHVIRTEANHYNFDDIVSALAQQPASEEPARFSVNNIRVERGGIVFIDRPAKAKHVVADLELGVPFISSLPSQVQIFVEPLLSAKVNDTPILIQGKARPFAKPRDAIVELTLNDLDLTRFIDYLPAKLRIKVPSARLALNMSASFVQPEDKPAALVLNGSTTLKSLQLNELSGKPVLKLAEMKVDLRDASVLGNRFDIARIAVHGLQAAAERSANGQASWERWLPSVAPVATTRPSGATTSNASPYIVVGEVDVQNASLHYADALPSRPVQAEVEEFGLSLRKVAVDTGKKTVSIAEVRSDSGNFLLRQDKRSDKSVTATAPAAQEMTASAKPPVPPAKQTDNANDQYVVTVGRVGIDNWSARLEDRDHAEPAVTTIAPLSVAMQDISTAANAAPTQINVKAGVNKSGQLAVNGKLALAPFSSELSINMKGVDILPVQPYVTDSINLRLTRASLTTTGQLRLATGKDGAVEGGYQGDVTIGNLATVDKLSGNDFLRWKSLFVGGMNVRFAPFALKADQVALSDFFARVIIDPSGRINLQDIARGPADAQRSLTESGKETTSVAKKSTPVPDQKTSPAAPLPIEVRKLTLQGGRVRFTDNFIKPNYTATLASLGGTVTDLSAANAAGANIDLHGEVNNAPLAITGRVNPLRGDLFLDLQANVRGMELAPLSAYAGRYVGYGIEKGKLSFDVAYRVEARKLTARNRLVLDQLTFGDKVDSPSATKLPVQFAVALLRDRNGVIDVNLPVGGSLDDPQFSIGALLARVIGNVILKAVSQPFALLGAAFGGGEQLSSMEFEPGRASISATAEEKLKALAKALTERPGLKLDIAGRVDPESDKDGLKRAYVERKVRSVKTRDLAARGVTPEPGRATVQPDEYRDLLTRAYRDEKFPKPRNVIGLPKSLSVEEMEQLMMANAEINEDDFLALGNQRAQAAKAWLQRNGNIPEERLFILASRIGNSDGKGGRVSFSLR
ncbi:DUF748 domain-containing protein [Noviherbaspirillum sp. Root189]|uniref:DUF748 domain-containing protein n=1 Tax=Noviherbaspirillum sp. Root189 TaxID=1736487 RepID=UPI00070D7CBD|nr:DUF748 domain-containing protein [Noviherbaspirillum sp. Root189]KRB89911.1 hypothetical protein ASE07_17385 [Noviherbaspirillum sp. Root189]